MLPRKLQKATKKNKIKEFIEVRIHVLVKGIKQMIEIINSRDVQEITKTPEEIAKLITTFRNNGTCSDCPALNICDNNAHTDLGCQGAIKIWLTKGEKGVSL